MSTQGGAGPDRPLVEEAARLLTGLAESFTGHRVRPEAVEQVIDAAGQLLVALRGLVEQDGVEPDRPGPDRTGGDPTGSGYRHQVPEVQQIEITD